MTQRSVFTDHAPRHDLPNRIVVSPMCQYNSTDGTANDWHLMHIGQFVLGGFGLIIAEMTDVNPVGRISLKCAGLYSDENEKAIKRVVDFAKQYGPSKHGLQIGHAGRKGSTKPPAMGGTPLEQGRRRLGDVGALRHPLRSDLACAARHDQGRDEGDARRLCRVGQARRARRL